MKEINEDNFDDSLGCDDESLQKPLTEEEKIEGIEAIKKMIKEHSEKQTPEEKEKIRLLGEKFKKEDEKNN